MTEFIKREDAQKVICWVCGVCIGHEPTLEDLINCEVCDRFAKIPVADAVEVIRCADCKYGNTDIPHQNGFAECELDGSIYNADYFCAYGDEKECTKN